MQFTIITKVIFFLFFLHHIFESEKNSLTQEVKCEKLNFRKS